jgi:DNA-binding response OmpR family regulator
VKVLIVEDDRKAARLLERGLREEGFVVDVASSGDEGEDKATESEYDVLVVDWRLPGKDGLALCRELRARGVATPVLMLTARDAIADRVAGLRGGADDYLTKPFAFAELLARIHALLRRSELTRPAILRAGDLQLDPMSHRVTRGGAPVALTTKEYGILELLMRHLDEVVTRTTLAERVWGEGPELLDNVVEVHVSRLRRKVDADRAQPLIETVRGRGYRLVVPPG